MGTFHTVAGVVAEAEAAILSIKQRHDIRAVRTIAETFTLPKDHPLYGLKTSDTRRFVSPMQKLRTRTKGLKVEDMETMEAYVVPPWEDRIRIQKGSEKGETGAEIQRAIDEHGVVGAVATRSKGSQNAYGVAMACIGGITTAYGGWGGERTKQNPYTTELGATARFLEGCTDLTNQLVGILLISRNRAMMEVLWKPGRQSGQADIRRIYEARRQLRRRGCEIQGKWIPTNEKTEAWTAAKGAAHMRMVVRRGDEKRY